MTTSKYTKNDAGLYVCPECGETKARANTMYYHIMQKHTGETKHVCSVEGCGKGFIQKSGLSQHMRQVHRDAADPLMECPFCDHSCATKANLTIHVGRKHGDGWIPEVKSTGPCVCTGCKESFQSATAYFYHAVRCFTPPAEIAEALAAGGISATPA
jgi:hypothetical protein